MSKQPSFDTVRPLVILAVVVGFAVVSWKHIRLPGSPGGAAEVAPTAIPPEPTPALPRDVPGLVAALRDPSPDVRRQAAEALGKTKDPTAALPLLQELADQDVYAKRAAAEALGLVLHNAPMETPARRQAVDGLVGLLSHPDSAVRCSAMEGLAHLPDRRAVPALIEVLRKDVDMMARGYAAWALGQVRDPQAVGPLIDALGQKDAETWKISYALGEIDDPRGHDVLLQALRKKKFDEVSGAADFFVRLNDPEVNRLLVEMLDKTRDGAVALALAKSPDPVVSKRAREFMGDAGLSRTDDD